MKTDSNFKLSINVIPANEKTRKTVWNLYISGLLLKRSERKSMCPR